MKTWFANTYYYLALVNPQDQAHQAAVEITSGSTINLVTTTWVLTEVGDALSDPSNRPVFLKLFDLLNRDPNVAIVPASETLFTSSIDMFRDRQDEDWSLTDCISFVVMNQYELAEALTGDHHFEQAGFRTLLQPD